MRRTDRLFDLIQLLRDGRLHKASDLAEKMEVSVRTIYRDMDTLVGSGIPVEGERGVGYILRAPVFMPPMALTQVELEALHLGAALVRQTADAELQEAADARANQRLIVQCRSPCLVRWMDLAKRFLRRQRSRPALLNMPTDPSGDPRKAGDLDRLHGP